MQPPQLTFRVDLPGAQNRLVEMILYISHRCQGARRFGGIKLNKILWKSDFDAYAARGVPVTGRAYQRLRLGPAPREMLPVHRSMLQNGLIKVEPTDFGDGIIEQRTVPLREPDLTNFTPNDISFVDRAIGHFWTLTGMETSDDSHGAAWSTRANGEPMPYETALLADRSPQTPQMLRLKQMIYDREWLSD